MQNINIRIARSSDAEALLKIYKPYILNTAITFEYTVPSIEEFRSRIENTLKIYPYFVAEIDGEIVGYAYAGSFIGRAAYDRAVKVSIYVDGSKRKGGIGGMLYTKLEDILRGCLVS